MLPGNRRVALLAGYAVLAMAIGCGSPEKAVIETWSDYHRAVGDADLASVKSYLAAGREEGLSGEEAALAFEMRSALVPAEPTVTGVELSPVRAVLSVAGAVEGQAVTGRITFVKESGAWKVFEEEWNVELGSAFANPDVDLASAYSAGPEASPQMAVEIPGHEGAVTALGFTRDGRHLVSIGYDDSRLCLWDASSGRLLQDVRCDERPCDLALLPDGSAAYLVDAGGRVTEWPIEWGAFGEPRALAGLAGRTPRIAVDADGTRAVTTSWDEPAKLWDLATGSFERALPNSGQMRGVAFSPVGPKVACGSHGDYFAVWDLDRLSWPVGACAKHRVPNVGEQSDVASVAYSPDGRRLATGHMDSSLSLWDMEKGRQIHNWYVQDCSAMDVEFSPCGTVLASAQQDGKVYLWDPETRRTFFRLRAHEGAARSLAFNPADGVTLATGGEDGAIRLWR